MSGDKKFFEIGIHLLKQASSIPSVINNNTKVLLAKEHTVNKPERWTYERRYTKVKDRREAIKAAITKPPSHSGVPPGFLQGKER